MNKNRPLIGIIVNEAERSFFQSSLYHIQKELFAADMDVLIFSTLMMVDDEEFEAAENAIFDLIDFEAVDGIILYAHTMTEKAVKEQLLGRIREYFKKPVVAVEEAVEGFEYEPFDDLNGAKKIVRHLTEVHGVRTMDYVGGLKDSGYHQKLTDNFCTAMKCFGYEIPQNRIHHGNDWEGDYGPIVDRMIENGMPDAVVCCSDLTASGIIIALSERGYRVPADVIVTGYSKNEPYSSEYLNITTVSRDPRIISVNAARHLIALIGSTDYERADTELSCVLEEGVTCGCREINLPLLAKTVIDGKTYTRQQGFDSHYNFMAEKLIEADSYTEYLWVVDWYTRYLGNFNGFWLCLNYNVMHTSLPEKGYTDKMAIPYMRVGESGSVELSRVFCKKEMLPAIYERNRKPAAFIFTPLHFLGTNYGYTVLSYGDSGAVYDGSYAKWLRCMTCALEKQRRHILYNDAVMDAQIRDSLTGLLNMRGYHRIMAERGGKFNDESKFLRIISIDIENLNGINETYGYSEGDKVLTRLGIILCNSAGDNDICVRVSGDEFFIAGILDEESAADDVLTSLEKNLAVYNSGEDKEYGISLCTARAAAPLTSKDVLETLPYEASCKRAMSKDNHGKIHKKASEVQSGTFDPEERQKVIRLLNENLFIYHFQPIVDAHTGNIAAYEALMRTSEEFKLSPVTILAHAEALGRLNDIEKYTMFNLFDFMKQNREIFGEKRLFVNSIPSCTLSDAVFEQLYQYYGDIMKYMVIEVTEQTEASEAQLQMLLDRSRRTGFQIAVDDYGTGYSNISNLLNFMPNYVKIDRSLIMNIHVDRRKQHFTKNIIDYAHDNNFKVLAEGVELSEELGMVISMGVDLIQGYYTAKPESEVVPDIRREAAEEIRELNRLRETRRIKKTYFTGKEKEIFLMKLDFDNYTDILINKNEYTIYGSRDYVSRTVIRIKDNMECKVNLVDLSMQDETAGVCILVGSNSKLTLNIKGNVQIAGSIKVPEDASLTICGDGMLSLQFSAAQAYGIGADLNHSYGNIGIFLKNRLYIHLDSERSIAIGGGYNDWNSRICIAAEELVIEQTGKAAVAIGCFYGGADVEISDTRLKIEERSASSTGIGSYEGSITAAVVNSGISITSSGDKIGGICTFQETEKGKNAFVNIVSSRLDLSFHGKDILGIGSEKGQFEIRLSEDRINALFEGAKAVGIGGNTKRGTLFLQHCSGSITVNSGEGVTFAVEKSGMTAVGCSLA